MNKHRMGNRNEPSKRSLNAHTMHVFLVQHQAAQLEKETYLWAEQNMTAEQFARYKLENGYA